MYKLVILYKMGFETLTFRQAANCNKRYSDLIANGGAKNPVVSLYMYSPTDELITCTGVRV